ncbi:hypothetical protein BOSE21B_90562 [Bosea sp. 21B]|nr:hypothetical protein BOSE21B_90562 [Bosea sp. 21B]
MTAESRKNVGFPVGPLSKADRFETGRWLGIAVRGAKSSGGTAMHSCWNCSRRRQR